VTHGLVVDLFAGGGGASTGLEAALGRPVDIAINHDAVALAVHKANHPKTLHLEADIWEVRPQEATGGRPVDVLWASPDCTHFSVAKGNVPRKQNIRSLAWAVVRWAAAVKPRIIFLENVQEFRGWGPLGKDGRPDKRRMGTTFLRWRRKLERLGYAVDHRVLDALAYGAPTRRKRLFIVARCDGQPIRWPLPTHGTGPGLQPVRTAAECIDWSIPCPSIFERERPLAEKTLWRIAQGIKRFVLENPRPFVVKVNHGKREARGESIDDPLSTVTATQRGHALVTPSLLKLRGTEGSGRYGNDVEKPIDTICAGATTFGLIAPVLAGVGGRSGQSPATPGDAPVGTITSKNDRVLVAPTLIQTSWGEREGQRPRYLNLHEPLGTVVAGGQKHALVSAFMTKHFGGVVGTPLQDPTSTVTAKDHHALSAATLVRFNHDDAGVPVDAPLPTVTADSNHLAEVRAFLTAFYGTDGTAGKGQRLDAPARTITSKARLGLVTVEGVDYQIVDIGMRMLEPHELLAAQFGRYAASYDLSAAKTKAGKVRLIGNSVSPETAEALVAANLQGAEEAVA
jgi:DNA (cytosine-5)-methyltransferase 1